MKYYVLKRLASRRRIDNWPFIKDMSFGRGEKINPAVKIPDPLEIPLEPFKPNSEDYEPVMPEYFPGSIPLFRDDLIEALNEFCVTNIDYYNAVIIDPDNNKRYTNYKAGNITSRIFAVDMERAKAEIYDSTGPFWDADFYELAIDPTKADGALLFRLAESISTILVHENVRDHLIKKGFTKLTFLKPEECIA